MASHWPTVLNSGMLGPKMNVNCGYIQTSFQNDLNSNAGWSITPIDNTVHASEILLNSRAIGSWISHYLHMWWTPHFQSFVFLVYHLPPLTKDGDAPRIPPRSPSLRSSTARDFFTSNESVCFPYVWWGKYPADPQWEDTQVTNGDGMGHLHDGIVDQIFSDDRSNKETHVYPVMRDENNNNFGGYFNLDTMIIYWNVFGKPTKNTKYISWKFFFFPDPKIERVRTNVFTLKLNTLSSKYSHEN